MGSSIKGLDALLNKLNNPEKLVGDLINQKGGMEIKCPNSNKSVRVPTNGTTCSCGQKINFEFTK